MHSLVFYANVVKFYEKVREKWDESVFNRKTVVYRVIYIIFLQSRFSPKFLHHACN